MSDHIKWTVVLVCPGEEELPLLAELSARPDTKIVAIADPDGLSLGAGLAEIMGLQVIADLNELSDGAAEYLIHPPLDDLIAPFVDQAPDFGLLPVAAVDFPDLTTDTDDPVSPPQVASETDLDFLEMETSSIHRTLSRIEEAMDREALLRWLLGLATRATGASSGSVMLFDVTSSELYLAFAYGLSDRTLHNTRVRLGEGIAGRVAASGKPELLTGNQHPGAQRDRDYIRSAICAPITWQGRLLGVLNISASERDKTLEPKSLEMISSLTHRFGMILDRFLRMQTLKDGELFRRLEETFGEDAGLGGSADRTLALWAEDLAEVSGAESVTFGVLTADGELLTGSAKGVVYDSPVPTFKAEVMASGRPQVIRSDQNPDNGGDDSGTEFILPVGRDPVRALVTLKFGTAARAHHFHTISTELLFLVGRHLTDFLDRSATNDQIERLTILASVLSDLAAEGHRDKDAVRERLLSAARKLTGSREAYLVTGPENRADRSDGPLDAQLHKEACRLLTEAVERGWTATVLAQTAAEENAGVRRSVLAVPLSSDGAFPGLFLVDKQRLHPLDGCTFSEFDAVFARRLSPLLRDQFLDQKPTLDAILAPVVGEQPAESAATAGSRPLPTASTVDAASDTPLLEVIKREMDRCDRYHTMLGLTGYRLAPRPDLEFATEDLVSGLARQLRTSDHVSHLPDGTLIVVVPEDIQSLPHLHKRVVKIVGELTGQDDLTAACASQIYPGVADSPQALLDALVKGLG